MDPEDYGSSSLGSIPSRASISYGVMDNTEGHDPSVLGSIPSRTSFYGFVV